MLPNDVTQCKTSTLKWCARNLNLLKFSTHVRVWNIKQGDYCRKSKFMITLTLPRSLFTALDLQKLQGLQEKGPVKKYDCSPIH